MAGREAEGKEERAFCELAIGEWVSCSNGGLMKRKEKKKKNGSKPKSP